MTLLSSRVPASQTASSSCTNASFVTKLVGSQEGDADRFGYGLTIADPYLVVGAPFRTNDVAISTGAVAIYTFNAMTDSLMLEAVLAPADGMANMQFGYTTAVSGDYLLVGAFQATFNGSVSGAAYLYALSSLDVVRVIPHDAKPFKRFGQAVAINGAIMAIAAPFDDHNGYAAGSVYLFSIQDGKLGPSVTQKAKLTANDSYANDLFGMAIAMTDRCLVVGAPYDDDKGTSSGSVYVYLLSADGSGAEHTVKVVPKDSLEYDFFGSSLGLSDTTLVVGADGVSDVADYGGAAYVFVLENDFSSVRQVIKLTPMDGAFKDHFGYAVAISGDHVIVGSYLADIGSVSDAGAAYYYRLDAARSNVTYAAKLTANDSSTDARLAITVAVSRLRIVLGAPAEKLFQVAGVGSVYLFATGCAADSSSTGTTSTATASLSTFTSANTSTAATTSTSANTSTTSSATTPTNSATTSGGTTTSMTSTTTTVTTISTKTTVTTTSTTTTVTTTSRTTTVTSPTITTTASVVSSSIRPPLSSSSGTVTTTSLTTTSTTLPNTAAPSPTEIPFTTTTSVTSIPSLTTAENTTPAVRGSRLHTAKHSALIPALVGSLLAMCVLAVLALLAFRRRKTQNRTKAWTGPRNTTSSIVPPPALALTGNYLDMVENPVYQLGAQTPGNPVYQSSGQASMQDEEEDSYYASAQGQQFYDYARFDGQSQSATFA